MIEPAARLKRPVTPPDGARGGQQLARGQVGGPMPLERYLQLAVRPDARETEIRGEDHALISSKLRASRQVLAT
jgi:hypothetical protein